MCISYLDGLVQKQYNSSANTTGVTFLQPIEWSMSPIIGTIIQVPYLKSSIHISFLDHLR